MGENFKEILEHFGGPAIWVTIIIFLVKFSAYFRPVTFLTPNEVEKSLAVKETRFLHSVLTYFFYIVSLAVIILGIASILTKLQYNSIGFLVVATIFYILFFYYLFERDRKKELTLMKIVGALFYMAGWLVLLSYFLSSVLNIEFTRQEIYIYYIFSIMFALVLAGILIVVCRPVLQILQFLEKKYVHFEDEKGNTWYVLYSLNTNDVMIGDKHNVTACENFKIIKKEELLNGVFKVTSAKKLLHSQETIIDLKSRNHFLITVSSNSPIKIEVCILNKENMLLQSTVHNLKEARELIAKYVHDEIKDLTLLDFEAEVVECCRKVRNNEQQEIWSSWKLSQHLKPTNTQD